MKLLTQYKIRLSRFEDAESVTSVHVQSWKTSYKGILDQEYLDNINYESRLANRKKVLKTDQGLHLVATYKEEIIGFCDAGVVIRKRQELSKKPSAIKTEKGEIYAIYILEEHQGKGVGSALFKFSRYWLEEKKLKPILVWVLKSNEKARHFYESQGGLVVEETETLIGENRYFGVGYRFL